MKQIKIVVFITFFFTLIACATGDYGYKGSSEESIKVSGKNELASCEFIGKEYMFGSIDTGNKKVTLLSEEAERQERPYYEKSHEERFLIAIEKYKKLLPILEKLNSIGYFTENEINNNNFLSGYPWYVEKSIRAEGYKGSLLLPKDRYPTNLVDRWEEAEIKKIRAEGQDYYLEYTVDGIEGSAMKAIQGYFIKNNTGSLEVRCTTDFRDVTNKTLSEMNEPLKCSYDTQGLISNIWLNNWVCVEEILASGEKFELNKPLPGMYPHTPLTALTCGNIRDSEYGKYDINENEVTTRILKTLLELGSDPSIRLTYPGRLEEHILWPLKCNQLTNKYFTSDREFLFASQLIQSENLENQLDETDEELVNYISIVSKAIGKPELAELATLDLESCKQKGPFGMGQTYLLGFVMDSQIAKLREALENGVDPNYTEPECSKPLIFGLVPFGSALNISLDDAKQILGILIEYQVDLRAKNSDGKNIFQAFERSHEYIREGEFYEKHKKGFDKYFDTLTEMIKEYY